MRYFEAPHSYLRIRIAAGLILTFYTFLPLKNTKRGKNAGFLSADFVVFRDARAPQAFG